MKALIVDALASGKGERKSTRDVIGAGPRSIAGVLERKGVDVRVMEAERVITQGKMDDFDVLLLSGMTTDFHAIRKVLRLGKGTPVILGGPITSDPLNSLKKTGADLGIVGEGEETLAEILDLGLTTIQTYDELSKVKGIVYRKGKKMKVNDFRPVMPRKIYDSLEPSTKIIRNYSLYYAARVYVEVLRGCSNYYRANDEDYCRTCGKCRGGDLESRYYCPLGVPPGCGYCSVPSLYGPPKSRSASSIIQEVEKLLDEGVVRIVLSAPCFLDFGRDLLVEPKPLTDPRIPEPNYSELEKLLGGLSNLDNVIERNASFMIENIKASLVTERAAKLLGEYLEGTSISIGFETGSLSHSNQLGRSSTPKETLMAIDRLKKAGLKPYVYFIHGLPGQNRDTVDDTVNAINQSTRLGAERIILYRFMSLPMSAFCNHPSAPPSIRDPLSKKIYEAAYLNNKKIKTAMIGSRLRVVVAERYDRDNRYLVAYPLKHGPVVLIESSKPIESKILEVEVTDLASDRMLKAKTVAMF